MDRFGQYRLVSAFYTGLFGGVFTAVHDETSEEYAVKLLRPDPVLMNMGDYKAHIESSMERIGVQQQVVAAGAKHWAMIRDVITIDDRIYCVMLRYHWSARKLVADHVELNARELAAIVLSVIDGLIELKKTCDRPHGRLTPENILLAHHSHSKTWEVALADPCAKAEIEARHHEQPEDHDFHDLGKLIYELVNHKPLAHEGTTPDMSGRWRRLGRTGVQWNALCTELLGSPLDRKIKGLEDLRARVQALADRANRSVAQTLAKIGVAAVLLGAIGGGAYVAVKKYPNFSFGHRNADGDKVIVNAAGAKPPHNPDFPAAATQPGSNAAGPSLAQNIASTSLPATQPEKEDPVKAQMLKLAQLDAWRTAILQQPAPAVRSGVLKNAWNGWRDAQLLDATEPDPRLADLLGAFGKQLEKVEQSFPDPSGLGAPKSTAAARKQEQLLADPAILKVAAPSGGSLARDAVMIEPLANRYAQWNADYDAVQSGAAKTAALLDNGYGLTPEPGAAANPLPEIVADWTRHSSGIDAADAAELLGDVPQRIDQLKALAAANDWSALCRSAASADRVAAAICAWRKLRQAPWPASGDPLPDALDAYNHLNQLLQRMPDANRQIAIQRELESALPVFWDDELKKAKTPANVTEVLKFADRCMVPNDAIEQAKSVRQTMHLALRLKFIDQLLADNKLSEARHNQLAVLLKKAGALDDSEQKQRDLARDFADGKMPLDELSAKLDALTTVAQKPTSAPDPNPAAGGNPPASHPSTQEAMNITPPGGNPSAPGGGSPIVNPPAIENPKPVNPPVVTPPVVNPPVVTPPVVNPPVVNPAPDRATFTDTIGLVVVEMTPGEFEMGSPSGEAGREDDEARHSVRLTHGFLMGQTPVTRGQFAQFVKETSYKTDAEREGWSYIWSRKLGLAEHKGASWHTPGFLQTEDHPVVCVSWNDARAFCQWLTRKDKHTCRLPSEAEWEYACRAGTHSVYFWGDDPAGGKGFCNASDHLTHEKIGTLDPFPWDDPFVHTSPVKSFRPNAWNLYDMTGNVWQWCGDGYKAFESNSQVNPNGAIFVKERVRRGGAWDCGERLCRVASRHSAIPAARFNDTGFRVVLEP